MHNASPLLTLQDLSVTFKGRHHDARAVEQVSLAIRSGELLGLAGESGCGKSTLAYALMGLLDPAQTQLQGLCHFDGQNYDLAQVQLPKSFRGQHIAMVFQSAMNALNPVLTVAAQLDDAILAHRHDWTATQRLQRIHEVLDLVDIPRNRLHAYPHQLSGGMKQRIGIAMALLHQPQLLILDEPTTALDVVVQRAIIQRIATLRHELGFAVLFITHDLSLLAEISDRIAIMYAGQIVEISPTRTLYQHPAHPYTQALLKAFPSLTDTHNNFAAIEGSPPPLTDLPIGCRFAPRCAKAQAQCTREMPALLELHERPQQVCRCWLTMPQGDR